MKLLFIIIAYILQYGHTLPTYGRPSFKEKYCIKMSPEKEIEINTMLEEVIDSLNNIALKYENIDITVLKISIEKHTDDESDEKETKLQVVVNDCVEKFQENNEESREMTRDENDKTDWNNEDSREINRDLSIENDKIYWNNEESRPVIRDWSNKNYKTDWDNEDSREINRDLSIENDNIDWNNEDSRAVNRHWSNENYKTGWDNEDSRYINRDWPIESGSHVKKRQQNHLKNAEVMILDLAENGEMLLKRLERRRVNPLLMYVQEKKGQDQFVFL